MNLINPDDLAKSAQPVLDEVVDRASRDLATVDAPAFRDALVQALDGLTVTVTITVAVKKKDTLCTPSASS